MTQKNHKLRALAAIGEPGSNFFDPENQKVDFETLFRLFEIIEADGKSPIHAALAEVICRIIEIGLIRDPTLELLVHRWTSLSAQAPDLIRKRIVELTGVEAPTRTIQHLVSILGGSAAQRGRRVVSYEAYLPDIFARHAQRHPRKELRCACCGYHFTKADLNPNRQLHAENEQLVLATSTIAVRTSDVWKPISIQIPSGGKITLRSVTGLTIDHIVPEEGLGWAGADNLEILCNFCNAGKLSYRWALEPISLFGAGGLADYPTGRPLNKLAQTTIVSALRYSGGKCARCATSIDDTELTVRPRDDHGSHSPRGLTPWNLRVLCYQCV